MAVGPYVLANVANHVQTVYHGALAKTLNEQNPSVARLAYHGLVEYGKKVERWPWPAVSSPFAAATTILDGGALPTAQHEQRTRAYLDWTVYLETLRIGRVLKIGATNQLEYYVPEGQARATGNGAAPARIISGELNRALPIISRTIHSHIINLSSNAATAIVSLGDAIASTTNTYAGINRAAAAYWQPYVSHNSGTNRALTLTLMETMWSNLMEVRGAMTTEIWSGRTAWNALRTLINTTSPSRNQDPTKLAAGASEIYWENLPVISMPNMDANAMYWLDLTTDDSIKLLFQHDEDFLFQEESTDSYDERWSAACHPILCVNNPRVQGALLDVQ